MSQRPMLPMDWRKPNQNRHYENPFLNPRGPSVKAVKDDRALSHGQSLNLLCTEANQPHPLLAHDRRP